MTDYKILAVDDEPFNLDLIEATFEAFENVHIFYASSGKEALAMIHSQIYDVVLLDISMPDMDGLEVLQKIKEVPDFQNLPILMVTANADMEKEALKLGASDFISKPYDVDILYTRTINYAKLNQFNKQIVNQNTILEQSVERRTQELKSALKLSKETEFEISVRLGRAGESRDPETGGHIKRVSHYSKLLAQLYGLDAKECELILYAAPLHDIGKIGIPDKILLKPGRFEESEFEIMKTHAQLGADMLEGADRFPILKAGYTIALEHHENYDGTGYPHGKKGEEIHLYARIITVTDVFDALSSKRCYKEAMPLEQVLDIMKKGAGKHFDPILIKLFFEHLDKFLEIKNIYKDENCLPFKEKIEVQSEQALKILFVDDNQLNRLLVKEMLILVFPNVIIDTYANAKDILESDLNQYKMILTDIEMPEMNGYEFFQTLRDKIHYKNPILALTGVDKEEEILKFGFTNYIAKPIDIKELENTIKKYF